MYLKRYKKQLTMEEYCLAFGDGLKPDNRWVKMAKIIPWDVIEEIYAEDLSKETGRPAIPARIAFGALYIKEQENLADEGTVSYLSENPYAQHFMGLKEFRTETLFEASMMVHFRKRFGTEGIGSINEILYARSQMKAKAEEEVRKADTPDKTDQSDQKDDDPPEGRDGKDFSRGRREGRNCGSKKGGFLWKNPRKGRQSGKRGKPPFPYPC